MTLTREPVPSREQVIAWVVEQITRLKRNRASSPSGIDPRFTYEIACCEAILTHLQSAETVAQERDAAVRILPFYKDEVDHWRSAHSAAVELNATLQAKRDRLTAEVARHVEAYKSAHDRAEKAEAEVTRLRGQWEALKARLDQVNKRGGYDEVVEIMAELEATHSGPAEEGR